MADGVPEDESLGLAISSKERDTGFEGLCWIKNVRPMTIDHDVTRRHEELRDLNKELESEQKERRRLGNLVQEAEQRVNKAQRDLDRVEDYERERPFS